MLPSIQKLCELFGVSRTVVREALRDLSARGLVRIINGRRAVVQEADDETLHAIFRDLLDSHDASRDDVTEIRRLLGEYTAARAATSRTSNDVARLRTLLSSMAAEIEHPGRYAARHSAFHIAVARIAANKVSTRLIGSMVVALEETAERSRRLADREAIRRSHDLCERIVDSIEKGDPSEATRSMRAYIASVLRSMFASAPFGALPISVSGSYGSGERRRIVWSLRGALSAPPPPIRYCHTAHSTPSLRNRAIIVVRRGEGPRIDSDRTYADLISVLRRTCWRSVIQVDSRRGRW